jgi:hypothetical protein
MYLPVIFLQSHLLPFSIYEYLKVVLVVACLERPALCKHESQYGLMWRFELKPNRMKTVNMMGVVTLKQY